MYVSTSPSTLHSIAIGVDVSLRPRTAQQAVEAARGLQQPGGVKSRDCRGPVRTKVLDLWAQR
jgi:hypothetical protein